MALPTYHELLQPVLTELADGFEHPIRAIADQIAIKLGLHEEELSELLQSGRQTVFYNRVGWARTYLKNARLIDSTKRGVWKITPRGSALLASGTKATLETLKQYPEYINFKQGIERAGAEAPQAVIAQTPDAAPPDTRTPDEAVQEAMVEIQRSLATELLDKIKQASPGFFERLVVRLLVRMGYGGSYEEALQSIKGVKDEGIDGVIKADRLGLESLYVQAKRWSETSVGRPEVQGFVGALHGQGASRGVFITTSRFSREAIDFAKRLATPKVVLIDGDLLATLLIEHDVGVSVVQAFAIKRLDTDFFEEVEQ